MSGNDERINLVYAPECECGHCSEWYTDAEVWILTEKSMLKRHIQYPVITFKTDVHMSYQQAIDSIQFVKCQTCAKTYRADSMMFKRVIVALKANTGKEICRGINGETFIWT